MDGTTEQIADFVLALTPEAVPATAIHEAKRRLVDSLGCAIAAIDSRPAQIGRSLARRSSGDLPATVIGSPQASTPELATFANTAMLRHLDYNDTYHSPEGGGCHPSDLIPTALAMGQALRAGGSDVLLSIIVGYEVLAKLAGTVRIRERGWDQGLKAVVAAATVCGKLLGLSKEELGHAVSLAVVPHVPVRQTRIGELSMWKGCATAGAARNGMFAAMLAAEGMTGPPAPFDGKSGIKQLVTGPFELALSARPDRFVIEQVHSKYRPAEYNAQGALDLILRMRDRVALADIERVDLETYWLAYSEIGMEPAKWDPHTRETADHSLPYLLAVALADGRVDLDSFTPARIADPALRPLMDRIHVAENKDFSRRFPQELLCHITIRSRDGSIVSDEIAHPRGHSRNPLSDAELDGKFESLVSTRGSRDADTCMRLRSSLWAFDTLRDVGSVLTPLGELAVADAPRARAPGPGRIAVGRSA